MMLPLPVATRSDTAASSQLSSALSYVYRGPLRHSLADRAQSRVFSKGGSVAMSSATTFSGSAAPAAYPFRNWSVKIPWRPSSYAPHSVHEWFAAAMNAIRAPLVAMLVPALSEVVPCVREHDHEDVHCHP